MSIIIIIIIIIIITIMTQNTVHFGIHLERATVQKITVD